MWTPTTNKSWNCSYKEYWLGGCGGYVLAGWFFPIIKPLRSVSQSVSWTECGNYAYFFLLRDVAGWIIVPNEKCWQSFFLKRLPFQSLLYAWFNLCKKATEFPVIKFPTNVWCFPYINSQRQNFDGSNSKENIWLIAIIAVIPDLLWPPLKSFTFPQKSAN